MSEFDKKFETVAPKKEDIAELVKNYTKNTKKKSEKVFRGFWYWLPQILMTVLSLGIIGLYQLVIADFDPKVFTTPDFWGNYLSFQMASWILILNILSMMYKIYKKKHKYYNDLKVKKNLYVTIDNEHSFIGSNAESEDRRRKIKAYKIYINQKINKILQKNEIYDLKAFIKLDLSTSIDKKKKRIQAKLGGLLHVLTDEWIEENIDNVKSWFFTFQYAKVTKDKLVSGAKVLARNHGEVDFEEHSVSVFNEYYLAPYLFSSVIMFILLSFTLTPKDNTLETYIMLTIKIFILLYNAFMTWAKTEETFERTKLKVIEETTSELGKYFVRSFSEEERKRLEEEYTPKPITV